MLKVKSYYFLLTTFNFLLSSVGLRGLEPRTSTPDSYRGSVALLRSNLGKSVALYFLKDN